LQVLRVPTVGITATVKQDSTTQALGDAENSVTRRNTTLTAAATTGPTLEVLYSYEFGVSVFRSYAEKIQNMRDNSPKAPVPGPVRTAWSTFYPNPPLSIGTKTQDNILYILGFEGMDKYDRDRIIQGKKILMEQPFESAVSAYQSVIPNLAGFFYTEHARSYSCGIFGWKTCYNKATFRVDNIYSQASLRDFFTQATRHYSQGEYYGFDWQENRYNKPNYALLTPAEIQAGRTNAWTKKDTVFKFSYWHNHILFTQSEMLYSQGLAKFRERYYSDPWLNRQPGSYRAAANHYTNDGYRTFYNQMQTPSGYNGYKPGKTYPNQGAVRLWVPTRAGETMYDQKDDGIYLYDGTDYLNIIKN
jgi:hypothetical protein